MSHLILDSVQTTNKRTGGRIKSTLLITSKIFPSKQEQSIKIQKRVVLLLVVRQLIQAQIMQKLNRTAKDLKNRLRPQEDADHTKLRPEEP